MKTLHDYISESETWATTPQPGDDFAIELAPDHLIESYVVETLEDGVVIEADAHAMSLLEEYGCMTETIRRYGPVGSNRGVGFTVAEVAAGTSPDRLMARTGMNLPHKFPRTGQTNLGNIPGTNLPDSSEQTKKYGQEQRANRPDNLKAAIRDQLGKHNRPNLPEQGVAEGPKESTVEFDRMMELAGIAKDPVEEDNSGLAQKALSLAPVGAMGTEIDEATDGTIAFQGRMIDRGSIELDDVHSWDYPDFSDAYISYATFTDGTPLGDDELDQFNDQYGDLVHELAYDSLHEGEIDEAKYQGREVPLGKPMAGDVKKSKVYVRDPATGNIKKVNFGHGGTSAKRAGQKTMKIKKSNPARRKSFRARHNCDNPGPRTKARYWSCRAW